MKFIKSVIYVIVFSGLVGSCNTDKRSKLPVKNSSTYDLNHPVTIELPAKLNEISGLVFDPTDTSVIAVTDEDGLLYKIHLNRKAVSKSWRFNKRGDYEELVRHKNVFYVLVSNGDIETVKFKNDAAVLVSRSAFPAAKNRRNEFEAMYYDDSLRMLILICKNCDGDGSKAVTTWGFDISTHSYISLPFAIDPAMIAQKLGVNKIQLKPSGAAINPVSNELYILASINKLIIITDRTGKFIDLLQLDPVIYKQPEGIAFDQQGNMYISNERGRGRYATILKFLWKPKMNG